MHRTYEMILSVSIFVVALGLASAMVLVLRQLDSDFTRPLRPWLYFTVILWAGIALFFVATTLQDIGVKALDSRLSSDPQVADRLYSSRWTRWFMPKRKGQ